MSDARTPSSQPASGPNSPEAPARTLSPRMALAGVGIGAAVLTVLAVVGIVERIHQRTVLAEHTLEQAAPSISVLQPKAGAPINSFVLPGNVTAYTDSPIYARTSGYLARWYFDIGSRVKKGALLAVISAPEVDQQLTQAQADLATAEANATQARTQAERYSGLVRTNAVSRQDADSYVNQAAATSAAVRSQQANVARLKQLQSYQKIYAPFDGVVTARTVDTGQLIDSGVAKELFHLQAIQTLRVYASLPQTYAPTVKPGMKVDLTFAEHPGRTFQGTLVRTAQAIDPASRTLLVEVDVDNKGGELLPGSLASVHFKTPRSTPVFMVPSAALIFRQQGMLVGTVVNGNKAHLAPVVIGEDDGATVQIVSGIGADDQIIQDPPDSLIEGETVFVAQAAKQSAQEKK